MKREPPLSNPQFLSFPNLEYELAARRQADALYVAGVDEAGRGALAGPVVAAAVLLPLDDARLVEKLAGVNDSKQLRPAVRERLYDAIVGCAVGWGIGCVSAAEIDRMGIVEANAQAMLVAIARLEPAAGYLLVDGPRRLPRTALRQQAIIRGDGLSLSIAAASILAKVTRDRIMVALGEQFPHHGFGRHKGYGTAAHRLALMECGPTPEHRQTFQWKRLEIGGCNLQSLISNLQSL